MHDGAGGGIGNYERELADNLKDVPGISLETKVIGPVEIPLVDPHIRRPFVIQRMMEQFDDADIIHLPSQGYAPALIRNDVPQPVVVTAHDLIPYVTNLTPLYRKLSSYASVKGLENADQIVSISGYTRKDIIENTNVQEENISVIYPSAELEFTDLVDSGYISQKYDISGDYILYVGSKAKRKNIYTLIKCMKYCQDLNLVLVGRDPFPFKSKKIRWLARVHGVEDQVIQTGYVEKEELGRFYKDALAFVFPSLYEGFGRPPLEAMSVGTPVIASTYTAVPEVVGDACLLCDPTQPRQWAGAVKKVRSDTTIEEELISAGYERANEFDFEQTAREMKRVYEKLL